MKREYHYLIAGLPDIQFDDVKLQQSILEMKAELKLMLHPSDWRLLELLFFPYDNKNLLNLLQKRSDDFDVRGNYEPAFLEEEIKEPDRIVDYMHDFILVWKEQNTSGSLLSWDDQLTKGYYEHAIGCGNPFFSEWFMFDLRLRNVQTALQCRRHALEMDRHLILLAADEVSNSLTTSSLKDFGVAQEFPFVERLVQLFETTNLLQREKEIDLYRWNLLDEMTFFNYFSIERILSYVIKLFIIERWTKLDKPTATLMRDKLLKEYTSVQLNVPITTKTEKIQ